MLDVLKAETRFLPRLPLPLAAARKADTGWGLEHWAWGVARVIVHRLWMADHEAAHNPGPETRTIDLIAVFVSLVFLYSLISRRLERTGIAAPIMFTAAGILSFLIPHRQNELELSRKAFLLIAEVGLVMTLFTDATHLNLRVLKGNGNLPVRLLSTGMLLSILLGVIGALVVLGVDAVLGEGARVS